MKQSALERSIAQATGETVTRIRNMGFSLMRMPERGVATDDCRDVPLAEHRRDENVHEPHAGRPW